MELLCSKYVMEQGSVEFLCCSFRPVETVYCCSVCLSLQRLACVCGCVVCAGGFCLCSCVYLDTSLVPASCTDAQLISRLKWAICIDCLHTCSDASCWTVWVFQRIFKSAYRWKLLMADILWWLLYIWPLSRHVSYFLFVFGVTVLYKRRWYLHLTDLLTEC